MLNTLNHQYKLFDAVRAGNLDEIKHLCSATDANNNPLVDVNKGDNHGWTALHWAARNGQLAVVKYLVSLKDANNNPLVDVNKGDNDGVTALHYAAME